MLPETKAILFNLFRDYLSTPQQKEKIIKMQREERLKKEEEKRQKTNNIIFNESNIEKPNKETHTELVKYKESLFLKIINRVKKIFI